MQLHAQPELAAQHRMVDDASGDVKVREAYKEERACSGWSCEPVVVRRCGGSRTWSWPTSNPACTGSFTEGTATWCCTRT